MKTIVWDVDDVLNNLMECWFAASFLPAHPDCGLTYQALSHNPPHGLLGISLDDYRSSLDAFRLSREFASMSPSPEILAWFEAHGARFRHVALTATPLMTAPASASWVLNHFGRWIRTFAFVPSERAGVHAPEYDTSKAEYINWLRRGNVLIDDNPQNTKDLSSCDIISLTLRAPWNEDGLALTDLLSMLTSLK